MDRCNPRPDPHRHDQPPLRTCGESLHLDDPRHELLGGPGMLGGDAWAIAAPGGGEPVLPAQRALPG